MNDPKEKQTLFNMPIEFQIISQQQILFNSIQILEKKKYRNTFTVKRTLGVKSIYPWDSMNFMTKFFHISMLLVLAPILCTLYILSPKRDHQKIKGPLGYLLRQMDTPFNR